MLPSNVSILLQIYEPFSAAPPLPPSYASDIEGYANEVRESDKIVKKSNATQNTKPGFKRAGSVRVSKVLESYGNSKCHFPGPAKFWKEKIFKMATEEFWIFVWKSSKISCIEHRKCLFNQLTHYRSHMLSCLQEGEGGGGNVLSSSMLSADWLGSFNANLVCISATRVADFIGNVFSFSVSFKLRKMRSSGAFYQGKEAMTDSTMIRLLYFISPLGLRNQ